MYPNNDPVAFLVAFYGCLLAEVVPVPIEVPLSKKVTPTLKASKNNFKKSRCYINQVVLIVLKISCFC